MLADDGRLSAAVTVVLDVSNGLLIDFAITLFDNDKRL